MHTALFELGEHSVTGPAYDLDAAANFYLPIADKAAAVGLGDISLRLAKMAEIDAQIVGDAKQTGQAPIFLSPDAYPIEGEAPQVLGMISLVRRLITQPSIKPLRFGPVNNAEGDDEDKAALAQIEEIERLLVHPEYQPLGMVQPDYRTVDWYMPTVLEGIAIQKEEKKDNGNEGRTEWKDGGWVQMPYDYRRVIGLTVYRTSSTPKR